MSVRLSDISTTKMTSKGQVVIPEEIREYLHLESGVKFVVMATDDSIIFKKIDPIPEKDIKALLKVSRGLAKKHGLTKADISESVKSVRKVRKRKTVKKKCEDKKIFK